MKTFFFFWGGGGGGGGGGGVQRVYIFSLGALDGHHHLIVALSVQTVLC